MMQTHTAVTFIPINKTGKILMQLRDDGGGKQIPYPNTWNFLGGAVEAGENYLECVIREADEECEMKLKKQQCELIYVYNHDDTVDDQVFVCKVRGYEKVIVHEGREMRWMSLSEIKKLKLAFEQKKIIPQLEKYLKK